ncbi:MAG: RsmB/NOP family class I SAM-dependent RNA methyltransferase [Magnetococcales bacterium]|nr:RsmB/NOP family class I SAM-dependent RNA methyltransferase [Magnetococcales bacterium]
MMRIPPLLLNQLVGLIEKSDTIKPAHALNKLTRNHPELGGRDRRFLSNTLFAIVRHRCRLTQLAPTGIKTHPAEALILSALRVVSAYPLTDVLALFDAQHPVWNTQSPEIWDQQWQHAEKTLSAPCRHSIPEWIWQRWCQQWSEERTTHLARALLENAPTTLRVNTLRTTRQHVAQRLQEAGLAVTNGTVSQDALILERVRHPVLDKIIRDGLAAIQDQGSQLASRLLDPKPNEFVVDFCAGAGGKSLHIAALMAGRGKLLALDNDPKRLKQAQPRFRASGTRIIKCQSIRHEGDTKLRQFTNKADRVLVDAPCSGSGTLRRDPALKWSITPEKVEAFHQRQCALLSAGSRLVRPNGRLVYVTCSLFERENRDTVESFLNENSAFNPIPVHAALNAQGIPLPEQDSNTPWLTLTPDRHGTDGFFLAAFQRRKR